MLYSKVAAKGRVFLCPARPTAKAPSSHEYKRICELDILPTLGEVKLARLEPLRIERLLAGIQARRQAQHTYMVLHRACVFAVRWHWLAENPCDRVQRPPHRAKRSAMWSPEQLRTFLEGSREHWLGGLWYVLLASGCRAGELLALTWQDVDLDAGTIRIAKTLQRVKGQVVVNAPKTEAGQRTVEGQ